MILFPLLANWMWFQILAASPLSPSRPLLEDSSDACLSLLPIPFNGD